MNNDYPTWCKSEAARFIWEEMKKSDWYDEDKYRLYSAVMHGATKEELAMFATSEDVFGGIRLRAEARLEESKDLEKNDTIDELIRKFVEFDEEDPFVAINAREELQDRFKAQAHQDQIKIVRTFLGSDDDDSREWCYETLQKWWDDSLIPDVKMAWENYEESGAAAIVALRLPLEYVNERQEDLEEADYVSVCMRLGVSEEDCYTDELTRKEYLTLAVHNHWTISDDDADELLFGFVLDIQDDNAFVDGSGPGHGIDHDGVKVYMEPKRFLESWSYTEPSLFHIVDMPFYVDALGRLGKISTLRKLNEWNNETKNMLAFSFTLDKDDHCAVVRAQQEGLDAYIRLIWKRFMNIASNTFPFGNMYKGKVVFRKTHNKFHFAKQEQKEYYPGYEWEEESPF